MLTTQQIQLYNDNKLLFGKFYFPHYFRKDSPPFHLNIIKEASNNLEIAMQAPRGGAKSTVETFLDSIHGICVKKERFIVVVQNTYAKAAGSLNNLKYEFRYNEKLMGDFGVSMEVKDAEGDTVFSHNDGFMCRVLCKGADQLGSIRGERFGAYRPTLIIVDDIEDDEMVKNPERRQELEKQFNDVLKYAGEFGETRVVVIGTILHDDSLLAKLLSKDKFKSFKKIFYKGRCVNDKGEAVSIWPEKWSLSQLNEMEADNPESFAKEIQGDPSSGSMETVLRKDFRIWDVIEGECVLYGEDGVSSRWSMKDCKAGVGIDLAWEEGQVNDYSAFVPGLITPANDLLIDSYIFKRGMRPDDWESIVFGLSERYQALTGKRVCIGIEKAKYEKVMKWFLREAQKRRNSWLWFKNVSWGTQDKIERIMTRLANRYANHSVYHRKGMGALENQLVRLRSTPHDDIADAAAMLPEILAFPSIKRKVTPKNDAFEFWRSQTQAFKQKERNEKPYVFGQRNRDWFPYNTKIGA